MKIRATSGARVFNHNRLVRSVVRSRHGGQDAARRVGACDNNCGDSIFSEDVVNRGGGKTAGGKFVQHELPLRLHACRKRGNGFCDFIVAERCVNDDHIVAAEQCQYPEHVGEHHSIHPRGVGFAHVFVHGGERLTPMLTDSPLKVDNDQRRASRVDVGDKAAPPCRADLHPVLARARGEEPRIVKTHGPVIRNASCAGLNSLRHSALDGEQERSRYDPQPKQLRCCIRCCHHRASAPARP